MRLRFFYLSALLLFIGAFAHAQDINLGKGFRKDQKGMEAFKEAQEYYDAGNYLQALPLYRSLEPQYGTNDYLTYKIGICLLYKSDELDESLDYLLKTKEKNSKAADIDLYIARAYHLNEKYDEAIASIDEYEKKKITPEKQAEAEQLRQYCINAKELTSHRVEARITNIEQPVNTENSEYVPVVTSDDSVLLYTYRGESSMGGLQKYPGVPDSSGTYFEDVFISHRENGKWGPPHALDTTINTDGHDAAIGISNDGQTLLIYKDEEGNGDICVSALEGTEWTKPTPLMGEINSLAWEGSATFSVDMNTIYFASEREGGYGGRDIWMATKLENGTWGNIKNLGPIINTQYDEDAPFLHPNGTTLIFSSQGHNSMGGYDIFKTELTYIDSITVSPSDPVNLGYPINTPGDDKYFVLGTDGHHGYYSSGKAGGEGQQDIYLVETDFNMNTTNVLLLSGNITLDGQPISASINIQDQSGKFRPFTLNSNAASGKYLTSLPQGRTYKVSYSLNGFQSQDTVVNATQIGEMQRSNIDIAFYTTGYLVKQQRIKSIDTVMFHHVPLDSSNLLLTDPIDYALLLRLYGDAKAPGLYFRVQVAAYNFPENYKYQRLKNLGSIDRIVLDDHVTRFTMGKFETLREAEAYKQKIIATGQTDAFITAEKDGKRYYLRELIRLHFFQDTK
ncbi:MAG: PD40 domain-containing protein [Bacteroidetes bacterium]|nr:PD40 domain-containing protein [Bacteroidota bacterium]